MPEWSVRPLLVCCALLHVAWGAELVYPQELHAVDDRHSLAIGSAPFAEYGFNTYGYNQALPGPTFRVKPGEALRLTLTNDLDTAGNTPCGQTAGEFCEASTTNFHTHGLHVSPKGDHGEDEGVDGLQSMAYSDDVLVSVEPGQSAHYHIEIPGNHMGGTHWYHPHHHHATALQAGGGAAGMLIVDDPDGYLPPAYKAMPDRQLVIGGFNLNTLQAMAQSAGSGLLEDAATRATNASRDTNVFLVNGQLGPTMTMEGGKWHRFRMVYAAVEQRLQVSINSEDGASCILKLMAKDGVYLHEVPRDILRVYLQPGARADVAVACTCASYPCTAMLGSGAATTTAGAGPKGGGRSLQQRPPPGSGGPGPGTPGVGMVEVDLLELTITEGNSVVPPDLPQWVPIRPCYLADLRDARYGETIVPVPIDPANRVQIGLQGGERRITWNGQGDSMTYSAVHAGGTMRDWPPMGTMQVGQLYEFAVSGANAHPLHIHVNPFQITDMPDPAYGDDYFRIGDWHDVLLLSDMPGGSTVTVRFQTDRYTGKVVVHCHILEHEDEGMMNIMEIVGQEGTIFSGFGLASYEQCYQGEFAPPQTGGGCQSAIEGPGIGYRQAVPCDRLQAMLQSGGPCRYDSCPGSALQVVVCDSILQVAAAAGRTDVSHLEAIRLACTGNLTW